MNKIEKVYQAILKEEVVNSRDLNNISKEVLGKKDKRYLYCKYISKLIKDGKVLKIKRGMYFGIPLDKVGERHQVDRYILAEKVESGYALGYHSALELHGAAYSAFNSLFILIKKENRFRSMTYQGVKYFPVINRFDNAHLTNIKYKNKKIIITDPARTFVECLSRVDLCGGWEECLKSLMNLRGVEVSNIIDVINIYKNKTLGLKSGYILELLSETSPYFGHIKDEDLRLLLPTKNWIPIYFDRDVQSELIKKWGLYVPIGFEEFLRGI